MSKAGASYGERDRCPVYIEGRWKPMIIRRLGESDLGFGELRRSIPGVTITFMAHVSQSGHITIWLTRSRSRSCSWLYGNLGMVDRYVGNLDLEIGGWVSTRGHNLDDKRVGLGDSTARIIDEPALVVAARLPQNVRSPLEAPTR